MRVLLFLVLVLAAGCASQAIVDDNAPRQELAVWQLLQHKEPGQKKLEYEDRWFRYDMDFEYVVLGKNDLKNSMTSGCPIDRATFKVVEKETGVVVRSESFTQVPCESCHKR